MKVAVVGGTGTLGKPLVGELAARGDEVLALSRSAPRELPGGASHRRVDLTTGEGLAEALSGVEEWQTKDPIEAFARRCVEAGVLGEREVDEVREKAEETVVAAVAQTEPSGRRPDVAGPEVLTLSDLARAWRDAGHSGLPLRLPMVGRIGRPVREGALCDPDAAAGGPTFEEWLGRG